MSLVDAGLWLLDHGDALGPRRGEPGHEWLRGNMGEALGWAEFALMAGLSCDYLEHLGRRVRPRIGQVDPVDGGHGRRPLAAAVLPADQLVRRLAPVRPHRVRSIEEYLLFQASHLIWAITLLQVTPSPYPPSPDSSQVLDEMKGEDEADDPFRPASQWTEELDVHGA